MKEAITIWIDESTEIMTDGKEYNLVGYLITNSDTEEFEFLNQLKQARKPFPSCWNTLHGCEINDTDNNKIELIKRRLNLFLENKHIKFHGFLYKKNSAFFRKRESYEKYFAKQSVFSLANKMKASGIEIQTMFANIGTLTVIFDRRRSHTAEYNGGAIERYNDLEKTYISEIKDQIKKISLKDSKDLTIRFSFVSSECFDAMQFTDIMLYLLRCYIENKKNIFTSIFDEYFLNNLNNDVKKLGLGEIFKYDKKFNFFKSNK